MYTLLLQSISLIMFIEDSDRYGIVVDAGSSGSRIHIYRWQDSNTIPVTDAKAHSVPQIHQSKDWVYKVTPGLSSFEDHPKKSFTSHIKPLLEFAETIIPSNKIKDTPVFVQCTAGMRLLKPENQKKILENVCKGIKKWTDFLLVDCDSQVQVIDGQTEGLYGWLSLNYLSGYFDDYDPNQLDHFTYGFMDMGGASAQIAFEPSDKEEIRKHQEDISTIKLKTVNGDVQEWNVFVTTWLGFGANQARQRYFAQLVNSLPENINKYDNDDFNTRTVYDPCLPQGYQHNFEFKDIDFIAIGKGDFEQCSKMIYPLLLKNIPCYDEPCLFNGIHVPRIDFTRDRFVGISEYWYIPNDIFKLGGPYDFNKFLKGVKKLCNTDWEILRENNLNGKYNNMPEDYLAASCFKSAWILNVLHEGFEMPKEKETNLDPSTNLGENPSKDDPIFQSLSDINGTEISWTLGRILLFVSGSIMRGNSIDKVGIYPSKLEVENLGKTFISGTLLSSTSRDPNFNHYKLIMILIIFSVIIIIILYFKSTYNNMFHLRGGNIFSKVHKFINFVTRKIKSLRHKETAYGDLSKLEEGIYDEPPLSKSWLKKTINNNGISSTTDTNINATAARELMIRSQSTGNLTMDRPLDGSLARGREQFPFMRSISRANIASSTNFQMSDLRKNVGSDHEL